MVGWTRRLEPAGVVKAAAAAASAVDDFETMSTKKEAAAAAEGLHSDRHTRSSPRRKT